MIKNFRKFKQNSGFTIIELMAVAFIIALISSIVLANFRGGQKQYVLNQQTQALAQFIREAQNRAMASSIENIDGQLVVPKGGYGAAFFKNEPPILYADIDGDYKYSSNDVSLKSFGFDAGVQISKLVALGQEAKECDINFLPPEPTINIYCIDLNNNPLTSFSIYLDLPGSGLSTKFINVFKTGVVQIGTLAP